MEKIFVLNTYLASNAIVSPFTLCTLRTLFRWRVTQKALPFPYPTRHPNCELKVEKLSYNDIKEQNPGLEDTDVLHMFEDYMKLLQASIKNDKAKTNNQAS